MFELRSARTRPGYTPLIGTLSSKKFSPAGRVDLGVDYSMKDGVALGFQGYYSGIGDGSEFESYGAGLRLRMEF